MKVRTCVLRFGLISFLVLGMSACGSRQDSEQPDNGGSGRPISPGGGGTNNGSDGEPMPVDHSIMRGRWEFVIEVGDDVAEMRYLSAPSYFASKGSSSQLITANVAEAVTFTVANNNFVPGTPADGVVSFGSLDVTALRDNALRVCGTGNARCTKGKIRIYTNNAAGPGLWSAAEGYGLPILTGTSTVGQGTANAATVVEVGISANKRVLKMSDFTSSTRLAVPVSVDFTDAAASSYSSTLVVEYVIE